MTFARRSIGVESKQTRNCSNMCDYECESKSYESDEEEECELSFPLCREPYRPPSCEEEARMRLEARLYYAARTVKVLGSSVSRMAEVLSAMEYGIQVTPSVSITCKCYCDMPDAAMRHLASRITYELTEDVLCKDSQFTLYLPSSDSEPSILAFADECHKLEPQLGFYPLAFFESLTFCMGGMTCAGLQYFFSGLFASKDIALVGRLDIHMFNYFYEIDFAVDFMRSLSEMHCLEEICFTHSVVLKETLAEWYYVLCDVFRKNPYCSVRTVHFRSSDQEVLGDLESLYAGALAQNDDPFIFSFSKV